MVSYDSFVDDMRGLTMLPRRKGDNETEQARAETLWANCRTMPREQFKFMVRTALDECEFFPAWARLKVFASAWPGYRRDITAKAKADFILRENDHLKANPPPESGPLTRSVIDSMSPDMIKIGLSRGWLVKRDGVIVDADEGESS